MVEGFSLWGSQCQLWYCVAVQIIFEETLYQRGSDGKLFAETLKSKGILPGIKVRRKHSWRKNTQFNGTGWIELFFSVSVPQWHGVLICNHQALSYAISAAKRELDLEMPGTWVTISADNMI